MTVSSTARSAGPFVGNGATTSFPFTFKVFTDEDLEVTHTDAAGTATILTLNAHYSVSLNADQDTSPGGTITYPLAGAALADPASLAITGDAAYQQATDISNAGRFLPRVVENALDLLTILAQQLFAKINRALIFPAGEGAATLPTVTQRKGNYLAFDAVGQPVASAGTGADAGLRTDLAASGGAALSGFLQAGTGTAARTTQAKLREVSLNLNDMTGADPTGVTESSAALTAALALSRTVDLGGGTWLIGDVTLPATGAKIRGAGKGKSILKIKAGVNYGLKSPNFGVRADGAAATFVTGLELADLTVDIDLMTNADASRGIALEDGWDHTLRNVNVIDSLDEASSRWGLYLGRSVYTTTTYDCVIGRVAHVAAGTSGAINNFGTTITHHKLSAWHVKGRYYADVNLFGAVIQKDVDKFDLDLAINNWSIVGGDFEGSGNFIRTTTAGSVSNIFTAGNAFGGFTGTLFGGAAGRPGSSIFMDEYMAQAGRAITSISRVGTTATAQVVTTLANGIYAYQAPIAGQWITVTGCGAPFDGERVVSTSDPATNIITFEVANAGALNGTAGSVKPDSSRNYRYAGLFANKLLADSIAPRFLLGQRVVLPNQIGLWGFKADGTTEVPLISVDALGRWRAGDGVAFDVLNDNGNLRNTLAGKGFTVTSPDGLTTKVITINNVGAIALI